MDHRHKVGGYVKLAKLWERSKDAAVAYHSSYYAEKFRDDADKKLVGVYIDITGNKEIYKRPEMVHLLKDCKNGAVNLIFSQTRAYLAANTENWNLQDIYSDEGKSGTSLRKRDAFKRMMRDAKDQKMDLIICASISRFARNFSDCMTQMSFHRAPNFPC